MRIQILDEAEEDLVSGYCFYTGQAAGLGEYFLNSLYADIDALHIYAGIHEKYANRYYRMLASRFPFAIYYTLAEQTVYVHAVLDSRRNPAWVRKRLA